MDDEEMSTSPAYEDFSLMDNIIKSTISLLPIDNNKSFCETFTFGFSAISISIVVAIGLLANSVALIVLRNFGKKSAGAATVTLILTVLALADMTTLFFRIFVRTIPAAAWYLGAPDSVYALIPVFYVWIWPCVTLATNTSLWITVVLTIHRYIAVCHPHKAAIWCAMKRTRKYVALAVISVVLFSLPVFFDDHLVKRKRPDNTTYSVRVYTALGKSSAYQLIYKNIMYQAIMYVIPNALLMVLTILLIRALIRSKKLRNSMKGGADSEKTESESSDEITKMLVTVVIVSLVCNVFEPIRRLLEFLNGGYPSCETSLGIYIYEQVAEMAALTNSSANFFICCWTGREFREILKRLCCCGSMETDNANKSTSNVSTVMTSPNQV